VTVYEHVILASTHLFAKLDSETRLPIKLTNMFQALERHRGMGHTAAESFRVAQVSTRHTPHIHTVASQLDLNSGLAFHPAGRSFVESLWSPPACRDTVAQQAQPTLQGWVLWGCVQHIHYVLDAEV
jgi:hypothetical protein